MIVFRLVILFFIFSYTHTYADQYSRERSSGFLQSDENSSSMLKDDNSAISEIIPLIVEFPDYENNNQLISINVCDVTPVKELLIEIGRLADINLDIDPKISGNIILKIKDKTINEAIESIAYSAKLRYSIDNDVIRVEQDLPYSQNYYVDFINIQRSAESNFIISNDIINSKENNKIEKPNNVMKSQYSSDLWHSLERGLNTIMDANGINDGEFISLNRETGIIILNARKDIHKAVKDYVNKVKRLASSQVMIEAKVVEITLDSKNLSGICLNDLDNDSADKKGSSLIFSAGDLESLVKSLNRFGSSTVISSTRIHATNNQQAMISFTKNHVYFVLDKEKSNDKSLITKINSVPVGVILTIHPSINTDTGEILMDVHPTLSRINGYTQDPGIEYIAQKSKTKLNSNIPIVEVREINSTLKIKSGEIMVIGGLMENREDKQSFKAKLKKKLKKEPVSNMSTVETVIFLKATIIPTFSLLSKKDKNLYLLNYK
ncbi:type II secretion system protein GspD [Wolbachia endosymbiont of Chironomus riparius]|uniref:type II secretion system protein GspD n=1 Tax=Wolbachia endosymbiont of Chironomus riparius TaxID=2883238 RepID=UPI00209C9AF5|nr:secretion system protein [Wolbachia endosymbiont of Chironomus riparius]